MGFFVKFLWNKMAGNVDEDVDRLGVLFEHFVDNEVKLASREDEKHKA